VGGGTGERWTCLVREITDVGHSCGCATRRTRDDLVAAPPPPTAIRAEGDLRTAYQSTVLIVMQIFVGDLALASILLGAAAVASVAGCSSSANAGSGCRQWDVRLLITGGRTSVGS
jgi:hypothetical protein